MAALKGQLVLAGGSNYKRAVSNITVWDATPNQWCDQYPAMPTAQSSPTIVGYIQALPFTTTVNNTIPSIWQAHQTGSSLLALHGHLLAVGDTR